MPVKELTCGRRRRCCGGLLLDSTAYAPTLGRDPPE